MHEKTSQRYLTARDPMFTNIWQPAIPRLRIKKRIIAKAPEQCVYPSSSVPVAGFRWTRLYRGGPERLSGWLTLALSFVKIYDCLFPETVYIPAGGTKIVICLPDPKDPARPFGSAHFSDSASEALGQGRLFGCPRDQFRELTPPRRA